MYKYLPLQNLAVLEGVKIAKMSFRKSQKFTILYLAVYKNSPLLHVIELLRRGLYLYKELTFCSLYKYWPLLQFSCFFSAHGEPGRAGHM